MNYYKDDNGSVIKTESQLSMTSISEDEFNSEKKRVEDALKKLTESIASMYGNTSLMNNDEFLALFYARTINALDLDNNTAIRCLSYHPNWHQLCAESYKTDKKGYRFQHEGKLYATVQEQFTFQPQWVPGTEGTSSIYSQVNWVHDGTLEDPIPVPENVNTVAFTYVIGKYYDEDGTLYLCTFKGEDDGTEHSFVYKPSEVPTYFTKIE